MTQDFHKDMVRKGMRARHRSGNSFIELTFMMPWLVFLFVGVFDFGFYAYALIATQNAARAVAMHNSISKKAANPDPADHSGCEIALFELKSAAYGRTMLDDCSSGVLKVTSTLLSGANSPDGNDAVRVDVTYQSALLIPIPGVLRGQIPITRTAVMRVNPSADF